MLIGKQLRLRLIDGGILREEQGIFLSFTLTKAFTYCFVLITVIVCDRKANAFSGIGP